MIPLFYYIYSVDNIFLRNLCGSLTIHTYRRRKASKNHAHSTGRKNHCAFFIRVCKCILLQQSKLFKKGIQLFFLSLLSDLFLIRNTLGKNVNTDTVLNFRKQCKLIRQCYQ